MNKKLLNRLDFKAMVNLKNGLMNVKLNPITNFRQMDFETVLDKNKLRYLG